MSETGKSSAILKSLAPHALTGIVLAPAIMSVRQLREAGCVDPAHADAVAAALAGACRPEAAPVPAEAPKDPGTRQRSEAGLQRLEGAVQRLEAELNGLQARFASVRETLHRTDLFHILDALSGLRGGDNYWAAFADDLLKLVCGLIESHGVVIRRNEADFDPLKDTAVGNAFVTDASDDRKVVRVVAAGFIEEDGGAVIRKRRVVLGKYRVAEKDRDDSPGARGVAARPAEGKEKGVGDEQ